MGCTRTDFRSGVSVEINTRGYGPEIVYIKGIHNTIADAISRLEYVSPDTSNMDEMMCRNWMTFSKCLCEYRHSLNDSTNKHNYSMNNEFAKEQIYPLTVKEIAKAQKLDRHFKATALKEKYEKTLIENIFVFCKNGKLVILWSLQHRAVSWYHHSLQHPGNTSWRNTHSCYVLETNALHCTFICQKLSILPGKQKTLAKVWKALCWACYYYPLGSNVLI